MVIDTKFTINAQCIEHNHFYTESEAVLFLCKDQAFLPTLRYYRHVCVQVGAGERQVRAVDKLIERVVQWQRDNPDKMKVPDVDEGPAGDRVLG